MTVTPEAITFAEGAVFATIFWLIFAIIMWAVIGDIKMRQQAEANRKAWNAYRERAQFWKHFRQDRRY